MSGRHRTDRPHFLLATDLPPVPPQLAFAAQLGERLHAQTTLFHVRVPITVAAPEGAGVAAVEATPAESRQALRKLAGELGTASPPHVALDVSADPPTAILAAAERVHADLIVLPTHGRSGLSRALLGSFAEQVLRRARRPVLLLTDAMIQAERRRDEPGPVMLATDLSSAAGDAAKAAADLARRLQLPLVVFSVVPQKEPPPLGGGAPVAAQPTPPAQRVQARLRELRQFAAELANDLAIEVSVDIHDDAAAAIVHASKAQQSSLLVVATHGRRGLARVLLGSVAERVVRTSTVPVVCVPVARE
ncbi:MAG: universal stress protein [Planctomycetota bacterium]